MNDLYTLLLGLQVLAEQALTPPWLYVVVVGVLGAMLAHARFAPGNYTVPLVTAILGALAAASYAVDLWSRGAGWRGFNNISDYEIRTIGPYVLTTAICIGVAIASYVLDRPRARQREIERQQRVRERNQRPLERSGETMFCSKCGTQASVDAQFCSKCGQPLAGATAAAVTEPVVINGVTYNPGSGPFAGLYSFAGGGWVTIENGQVRKASAVGGGISGGRIVAAIICFIIGGFALLQSFSWFAGFSDLESEGNPFAGMLVPLALAALAVGAGFVVGGIVLVSRKPK